MIKAKTKIKMDNTEINSGITKLGEGDVRNLYEHIMEIKQSMGEMKAQLQSIDEKVEIHNNYEKRITRLEKYLWIFVGALIVLQFVTNMGMVLLIKFLRV